MELAGDIGWRGAADILLVSVILYGVLAWLWSSRTRRLFRGVLVLAALYLGARTFQLRLAAAAFEALFLVVLLAAIVLYRDEIRRLIEQVATFGRTSKRGGSDDEQTALARVLFDLARERHGALVVVEGHDPVGSLLEGGVELDGLMNEPLLESLFHPASIGHDGALIVRGPRVWRFACHLPLSTNFEALGQRGTRHAAALGLSERSDALCIAVSEERGTVAVCEHGVIEEVSDAEVLLARLRSFAEHAGPSPQKSGEQRIRPVIAAAAMVIATVSWVVLVHGARLTQRSYVVAVVPSELPPNVRVAGIHPETVRVTVSGAGRDFYLVREKNLRVLVSLPDAQPGQRIVAIGAPEVELPNGLTLQSVQPPQVALAIDRR